MGEAAHVADVAHVADAADAAAAGWTGDAGAAALPVRERVHCQRCGNVIGEVCGPYFVERRGGRTLLTLAAETIVVCEQCGRIWAAPDRTAAGALLADLTRALGPLPVPLPARLRGPHGDLARNGLGEGKGC